MKFYIGVTDNKWWNFLKSNNPDEVNFWKPGAKSFRAITPGAPFLFKLHSPYNYIVGGGFFVSYSILSLSLAWECFGVKNGAESLGVVRKLIQNRKRTSEHNPIIGCTILTEPFFFEREEWLPVPTDWAPNIVSGKTYDTEETTGAQLWSAVQERLLTKKQNLVETLVQPEVADPSAPYGEWHPVLAKARIGQGTFRVHVTDAYHRRCSMT